MNEIGVWTHEWCHHRGWKSWYRPETVSTNDVAKEQVMADGAEEFCLFVTDTQTRGRGRNANSWLSCAPGSQLLSSWTFPLRVPPQHVTGPLIGLAVFKAARNVWPALEWSLKAPNDLYLKGKKIAGLLIEAVQQNGRVCLVIGLGFNVGSSPTDLHTSTHLLSENGLGSNLGKEKWWEFLSALKNQLNEALERCVRSQLEPSVCEELLQALNANPLKKERWLEVSPNGDLVGESRVVSWHQL